MDCTRYVKDLGRGAKGARSLGVDDARTMFGAILDGEISELQLGAILIALRIKSESLEELAGFKQAIDARMARIVPPPGPRTVVLPSYNGARKHPNLMPLLARLLAAVGVPVLIHGRFDFDTRVDPFALLRALGFPEATHADQASAFLRNGEPGYIGLQALCPGLDALLALRQRLGLRNAGHSLAKLIDPMPGASVRVVPVTHPEYLEKMEQFLLADGGRSLLLRGTEGEAYANPGRRPRLLGFLDGTAVELYAAQEGGVSAPPGTSPEVCDGVELVHAMLDGRRPLPDPLLDQAAACAVLAGAFDTREAARAALARVQA